MTKFEVDLSVIVEAEDDAAAETLVTETLMATPLADADVVAVLEVTP